MKKIAVITILSLTLAASIFNISLAQTKTPSDTTDSIPNRPKLTIGVGGGITSFYGNIGQNNIKDPIKYKDGFSIDIQKNFSRNLGLDFFFSGERLYGYENSISTNLNFLSSTFNEGIMLRYDFGHKENTSFITPFMGIGISMLSFNTKSDLKDSNGNTYYYWTDGTIRNLPQSDPNADSAIKLQRDYTFETSMQNEITLNIPLQLGLKIQLSPKFFLRWEETFNFAFTNDIDNVNTNNLSGINNLCYDKYLFSSITINYDIGAFTRKEREKFGDREFTNEVIKSDTSKTDTSTISKTIIPDNSIKDTTVKSDSKIPSELRFADFNNDGQIDAAELHQAIDNFLDGKYNFGADVMQKLIDYFFSQP
jgi:hypothetical protein